MNFPTHLTCPYCPAQALPQAGCLYALEDTQFPHTLRLKEYKCPAGHTFFAPEEKGTT